MKNDERNPNEECAHFSIGAVILAAGESRRMGRPKLLLPWTGTSVLGHLIDQWRTIRAEQVGVVHAASDSGIQAELERLNFSGECRIVNPAPERGMFSSIQCAARWGGWKRRLTHWAIILGDQPHLCEETLKRLLKFSATHSELVCQPRQGGHRRHPVVVPKAVFERLGDSAAADLNEFLGSFERAFCELEDEGLALDIDRPGDYERAVKLQNSKFQTPSSKRDV